MDFDGFDLSILDPNSPASLDAAERSFWLDLYRSPVLDAVIEEFPETRRYGPVQATVTAALPRLSLLNIVLGAASPGAVEEGHLEEALAWIEALEADCRVPVDAESLEAAAAEELLNQWGYVRTAAQLRLIRNVSPPDFAPAPGIEVIALEEFTEGFSEFFIEGFELEGMTGWLFDCLPGREGWRCYVAIDEDERPSAAAATFLDWEATAHIGLAATRPEARGRGLHTALIHRIILDAPKRCETLLAETCEPLGERDGPSAAARNLLRAGFRQASVRTTWQPGRG